MKRWTCKPAFVHQSHAGDLLCQTALWLRCHSICICNYGGCCWSVHGLISQWVCAASRNSSMCCGCTVCVARARWMLAQHQREAWWMQEEWANRWEMEAVVFFSPSDLKLSDMKRMSRNITIPLAQTWMKFYFLCDAVTGKQFFPSWLTSTMWASRRHPSGDERISILSRVPSDLPHVFIRRTRRRSGASRDSSLRMSTIILPQCSADLFAGRTVATPTDFSGFSSEGRTCKWNRSERTADRTAPVYVWRACLICKWSGQLAWV